MTTDERVKQIVEAQIGNLIMELAIKNAQIEALQAEIAELKDKPSEGVSGVAV